MISRKMRLTMALCGAALVAPVAMALTADVASATGYALMFDLDGGAACNPGGPSDCPATIL
jgi:hypothetical protein